MDVRDALQQLPEPDPGAADRVWARLQQRRRPRSPWRAVLLGGSVVLAAAALVLALRVPEAPRVLEVTATTPSEAWSAEVGFAYGGLGTVTGTDRDVRVAWSSGTLTAEVAPGTGTTLSVVTDEARVEVVGTVFSVQRDRLGTTTTVSRGAVRVACADGWSGLIGPHDGPRTCVPTGAVQLLSRADALADGGAAPDAVLQALDAGLAASTPASAVRAEILVRRMELHGLAGRVDQALADADAYLDQTGPRRDEVLRHAGWLAARDGRCAQAERYLQDLGPARIPADDDALARCRGPR